jgi:hypothetical protein
MSFGTELPLLLALGFVVLGPKRMQAMLGHVARAKAELHKTSRAINLSFRRNQRRAATAVKGDPLTALQELEGAGGAVNTSKTPVGAVRTAYRYIIVTSKHKDEDS